MDKDNLLRVGVITSAHGIRGEVNVFPTTDDAARFKKLKKVYLDNKKELKEMEISSVKFFKQMVILKFEGLDDRNEAERLRKCDLLVSRENAVKLKKDEYFVVDLIGISVIEDGTDALIGTLSDVISTGANDVYEVTISPDFVYEGKPVQEQKIYIPAIKDCVQSVDIENKEMRIYLMKGLIE